MPLTTADFPAEVQVAFFMFGLLSDRWEGMSGTYMGKDWSPLEVLLKIYEVESPTEVVFFMKLYEREIISYRAKEAEKKAKAKKPKEASGGDKALTHSIQG